MKLLKEFKAFISRGNIVDLSVAVIIGGAFGKIVSSLVNNIVMPFVGLLIGGISFDNLFWAVDGKRYPTSADAAAAGVGVVDFGVFLKNIVDFVVIALFIFLVIKLMSKFKKKTAEAPAPPVYICPLCRSAVDLKAVKCPACTADMTPVLKA